MKKEKIGAVFGGAENAAKDLLNKSKDRAIQAFDKNTDGQFDVADVQIMAGSVGEKVKKGTEALKKGADEKARELEFKRLRPIFNATLNESDFLMPKFIRITERDKKYIDSEVCKGSIGYLSDQKGMRFVNIFRDSLDAFGLTFFPTNDQEFYYVDPSDRNQYIVLDEYFGHLKLVRINELQRVAQALGAKHFRVTYKEEQNAFSKNTVKAHGKVPQAKADLDHSSEEKKYSTIEVAAEMDFPGHAPIRPNLRYMQRDPSIQNLIEMRMNESTPLLHQRFMLTLSNSSGITENDAIKIDAVLKGMKVSGNTTVASEARNESRRYLEYEIDF